MNYLTADEDMCDRLRGILEPVEIRDEAGKLLGLYTPHVPPEVLAAYEEAKKSMEREEVKRRTAADHGKQGSPLSEVLKRIQAREASG